MRYDDDPLGGFLSAVASEAVAPAGGTATAVVAAVGASLCEMACIHVDGDEAALAAARTDLSTRRERLLDLAAADAEVVEELFATAGEPTPTEMKRAAGVPLALAEACLDVLELATAVAEAGEGPAVADAAIGALLTRGALDAALFAVRGNLRWIEDPAFVAETERRAAEIEASAEAAVEQTRAAVEDR